MPKDTFEVWLSKRSSSRTRMTVPAHVKKLACGCSREELRSPRFNIGLKEDGWVHVGWDTHDPLHLRPAPPMGSACATTVLAPSDATKGPGHPIDSKSVREDSGLEGY